MFVEIAFKENINTHTNRREETHTIYIGDPHSVAAIFPSCKNRAKPKSAIFSTIFEGVGNVLPQPCANRIFCGFKSRCMIPLLCRASIAPAEIMDKNRKPQ